MPCCLHIPVQVSLHPNHEVHVPWHLHIAKPGVDLSRRGDHPNHETTSLAIPKKAARAIIPRMMSRQLTASIALSSPSASSVGPDHAAPLAGSGGQFGPVALSLR
jgi:hypothetical protein